MIKLLRPRFCQGVKGAVGVATFVQAEGHAEEAMEVVKGNESRSKTTKRVVMHGLSTGLTNP